MSNESFDEFLSILRQIASAVYQYSDVKFELLNVLSFAICVWAFHNYIFVTKFLENNLKNWKLKSGKTGKWYSQEEIQIDIPCYFLVMWKNLSVFTKKDPEVNLKQANKEKTFLGRDGNFLKLGMHNLDQTCSVCVCVYIKSAQWFCESRNLHPKSMWMSLVVKPELAVAPIKIFSISIIISRNMFSEFFSLWNSAWI